MDREPKLGLRVDPSRSHVGGSGSGVRCEV
jgi:hypothetical protein